MKKAVYPKRALKRFKLKSYYFEYSTWEFSFSGESKKENRALAKEIIREKRIKNKKFTPQQRMQEYKAHIIFLGDILFNKFELCPYFYFEDDFWNTDTITLNSHLPKFCSMTFIKDYYGEVDEGGCNGKPEECWLKVMDWLAGE